MRNKTWWVLLGTLFLLELWVAWQCRMDIAEARAAADTAQFNADVSADDAQKTLAELGHCRAELDQARADLATVSEPVKCPAPRVAKPKSHSRAFTLGIE